MQSNENRIKTELVMTALRVAAETLKADGWKDWSPHSPLGLLARAIKARRKELEAIKHE